MSEQSAGTQSAADNPQGTGQATEQSQQTQSQTSTQQQASQAASTAQQTQAQTQQPDLAALQQRLEQAEKSARHFQSQFSQARNQLQALTGVQPQADPLAERVQRLTQAGIGTEDAAILARAFQTELTPLQQENQQLRAAMQGRSQAQQAFDQAMQAEPELFADPAIQRAAWNALEEAAMSGNLDYVRPDYAVTIAGQTFALTKKPWKQAAGQQQTAPQAFRPAGTMSFAGNGSTYAPPAQQQQVEDPAVAAAADRMAARWSGGKTLSQLQQTQS